MRQDAQKPARKFCGQKAAKKRKTHPEKPEKGETGCVPGAREGCGRCGRVGEPEIRTNVNPTPIQHVQKGNRRKPSVFAGFVAGAEGLEPSARGFGVDVGKRTGNGEGARWRRFPSQAIKRRCWFGAAKKPGQKREGKPSLGYLKIFALLTNSKQREKMV